ncbi:MULTISPECIES: efflux RND transporter periplasmic adaptor subunit [Helicobacter]|uniref:Efflux RND transporter periplasmic adaptor subunit n=1 Tax=Helicobacter ibis TaxID=2962633 RepID=A0ABT4VEE3_9HELI|nr:MULTISPECIES: efflux RND transporter periplasmic adaptor subunit [Helicobacter]MDA3967496.1 efflux RND transporter periplasmic adaptor subunit [Helicobacter sp. WB40]MDA3969064.1 efflux RND transporter periplasmic adaptor subunit [Helicobacter ibis]
MIETKDILKNINPKKNYKKIILIYGSIICIICAVFGILYYINTKAPEINYITREVTIGDIKSTISANGSLSPTNEVAIGSVISGIVLEVLVDVNDRVKKGQILARIDSESIEQNLYKYQAQLGSAKAQLKSAEVSLSEKEWKYKQYKNLYEKTGGKTPSILELESVRSEYNLAISDVEIKKANIKEIETAIASTQVDLRNSKITTPIDGIVLSRSIEVGQSVAASFQAPEFFIVAESLEEMELNASISEADIGKVKEGQKVLFGVDSYPNKTFSAVVDRVNFGSSNTNSTSSQTTSTNNIVSYEARIYVDNSELLLRPGMSATADIEVASVKDALLVPSSALYFVPKISIDSKQKPSFSLFSRPKTRVKSIKQVANNSIWILENKVPKEIEVEVGISNGEYTEVRSSELKTGMKVIIGQN